MLYQKLLLGSNPYFISVGEDSAFEIHRHPEMELTYCMEGVCNIICENKHNSLTAGDFAVIFPMAAHEIPPNNGLAKKITIEAGYTLLGKFFEHFTNQKASCRLYKKSELQDNSTYKKIVALLEETATLHCLGSTFGELSVKGNLYKISALLLQMFSSPQTDDVQSKKITDVKKIDRALEKIHNSYFEPLSVEEVSTFCGYSKSNFCKIFKSITGDTFHNTLNRHRIEVACMLLRETDYTIEKIAGETGFADTKSFCRVFKKIMGKNAGEYRKSLKAR